MIGGLISIYALICLMMYDTSADQLRVMSHPCFSEYKTVKGIIMSGQPEEDEDITTQIHKLEVGMLYFLFPMFKI